MCLLLLCQLTAFAQGDETKHTLTVQTAPKGNYVEFSWVTPGVDLRINSRTATDLTIEVAAGQQVDFSIKRYSYGSYEPVYLTYEGARLPVIEQTSFDEASGAVVAGFIMPDHDATITIVMEYNPTLPPNPNKEDWNEQTGSIVVNDFVPGKLQYTIRDAISPNSQNADYTKVKSITVCGKMAEDDWNLLYYNYFTNLSYFDISRSTGLEVLDYRYSNRENGTLVTLVLPANIKTIGRGFSVFKALRNLTCFATTPPELINDALKDLSPEAGVFVPAESLPLYAEAEGWKDLNLLPITQGVHKLTVNMPAGINPVTYKDLFLELMNTQTGQAQRYVLNNQQTYTFNNLIDDTHYNVYIRNARNDVLGLITGIDIIDKDVQVSFTELKALCDVSLKLLTPTGKDVTSQATVTWTDAQGNYLQTDKTLKGQVEGATVRCNVKLSEILGTLYLNPADTLITIDQQSTVICQLSSIPQLTISGTVLADETGRAMRNANVTVVQKLNGLYSETLATSTDGEGHWQLKVRQAPTEITVAANGCVSQTLTMENVTTDIPTVRLSDITGTTVSLDLYYRPAVPAGEEIVSADTYDGFADIGYTIYDETHQQEVTGFNVQLPLIVMDEKLPEGTKLRITANSLNQKFMPITAYCTVDSLNTARVTLPITQMGSLVATFDETENLNVTGMLYKTNGQLVGRGIYEKNGSDEKPTLTFNDIPDGKYLLITMGESRFFNAFATLGALLESGLQSKIDYVGNNIEIVSGRIESVNNQRVPTFDESVFYYTGDNTRFSVNKTQVTVGSYVTLRAQVDFKPGVADGISNIQLLFDLPEGCEMVDNSMMAGARLTNYQKEGNRVSVELDNIDEAVRFCIIPTLSGTCESAASIAFTQNGNTIMQPIGIASFDAKVLSLSVPEQTALTTVPVNGIGTARSKVQVYDDGMLIGQTEIPGNGFWSVRCPLNKPYNLSTHSINAIITTPDGIQMTTETKTLTYNQSYLSPVVTMSFYNHYNSGDIVVKWDFRTGKCDKSNYGWPMDLQSLPFTFKIDFMDGDVTVNDTLRFGNVVLTLFLDDGTQLQSPATFNKRMNAWVVQHDLTTNSLPINVDVSYTSLEEPKLDREMINGLNGDIESFITETVESVKDLYHEFDELLKEEPQSETVTELNRLLDIADRDEAAEARIDSLGAIIAGEPIETDPFVERALLQIDELRNQGEVDYQTLKQIDALLDQVMEKQDAEQLEPLDLEALEREVEQQKELTRQALLKLRDEMIAQLSPVGIIDTTGIQFMTGDVDLNIPSDDRDKHIIIKRLTTIDTDQLLADGYMLCPMTDGTSIYFRYDATGFSMVDTKEMTLKQVDINWKDASAESRPPMRQASLPQWLSGLFQMECFKSMARSSKDLIQYHEQLKMGFGDMDQLLYVTGFCASLINDICSFGKCVYENAYKLFNEHMVNEHNRLRNEAWTKHDAVAEIEKDYRQQYMERHKSWRNRKNVLKGIEKDIADYEREIKKTSDKLIKADLVNGLNDKLASKKMYETQIETLEKEMKRLGGLADDMVKLEAKHIGSVVHIDNKERQILKKLNLIPSSITKAMSSKPVMTVAEWVKWVSDLKIGGTSIGAAVGGAVGAFVEYVFPFIPLCCDAIGCANDLIAWGNLSIPILRKLPCEEDQENLMNIITKYTEDFTIHGLIDIGQVLADIGGIVFDKIPEQPYHLQAWAALICDIASGCIAVFHPEKSIAARDAILDSLNGLKCKKKDDDKKDSSKKFPDIKPVRDPSGFVYEAVESNRLEGVKATCFYKEEVEDMYGDLHENIMVWDAEEYAQRNPLFTDAEGKYAWDVPTGLWQVKFEKDGYETAYSEWLPVPPPQLEVNIGMTQLRQPAVSHVKACTDGIDITFDKYMDPKTLTTENIFVTKGGQTVDGKIELLNAEGGYASKLRFNASLTANDKLQLTIRHTVESYAGLQMEQDFTQQFDVEQRITAIVADSIVNLSEGSEYTVNVSILPAEAAKGKTLTATALTDDVVTVTPNGNGAFTLTANSLGQSAVRFSLTDDPDLAATTLVTVRDAALMYVYAPRSSRMSGTEIYRGAEIRLTCQTAGATILYTLDGSCPCDAQNANVLTYTGPITATGEELTIRAMAVANGMAESDVVEFRYKVIDNPVSVEPILLSPFTLHPSPTEYYRLDGRRTSTLQKGLNIVRQEDGTVKKILVK